MVVKKKKSKKGKKKKSDEEKKDEEVAKPMHEKPIWPDPAVCTPICDLKILLADPPNFFSKLRFLSYLMAVIAFEYSCPITTRFYKIEERIQQEHGGSIGAVSMCLHSYNKDNIVQDKSKTLRDMGIVSAGTHNLIYDFKPVMHPLLKIPFSYKIGD